MARRKNHSFSATLSRWSIDRKGPRQVTSSWWTPDRHRDRQPALYMRAELVRALRSWFEENCFVEVEPACLQVSPGNETHIHAFATEHIGTDQVRTPFYLHTSPEFAMKKLLAAGEEKIVAFARVFRNRECGPLHASEFTMLEWYRANTTCDRVINDCLALLAVAATVRGQGEVSFRNQTCDLTAEAEHITVAEAFRRFADIDLLATLNADPTTGNRDALANAAAGLGLTVGDNDGWSDLFSKILTSHVEPNLGLGHPAVLIDYPLPEAALARRSSADARVAERFELYCCGVELANGFGELTDADEQRQRFDEAMDEKERIYGERYPIDDAFLKTLEIMPDASGVALGLDRLVLLAAGADRLDQVIWTPSEAHNDGAGS